MTTVREAASPTGSRQQRRNQRRRLVREQALAVVILVALFLVTVLLLGLQWLHAGPTGAHRGTGTLPTPLAEVSWMRFAVMPW